MATTATFIDAGELPAATNENAEVDPFEAIQNQPIVIERVEDHGESAKTGRPVVTMDGYLFNDATKRFHCFVPGNRLARVLQEHFDKGRIAIAGVIVKDPKIGDVQYNGYQLLPAATEIQIDPRIGTTIANVPA